METAVLKFGGSSVADDTNLNIASNKIIEYKEKFKNLVVVVSAQGKTTNKLTEEAKSLSKLPDEREMDMLLSAGEIMSAAKLSILLNKKECPSISLTGWQAGIFTNDIHQNAQISEINTKRIIEELNKNKVVIVTGFQGVDENQDVTTLGRGGSDTSAVSLAAVLKADKCYIFSDVDGIYTSDPKIIENAKKLNTISFEEMQEIADAGAKVLHNRCIKIGKKFNCDIIAASTFDEEEGTTITKEIEDNSIKGIIKNEDILKYEIETIETYKIYEELLKNNIISEKYNSEDNIEFYIQTKDKEKLEELLNNLNLKYKSKNIIKLSIIGYGVNEDSETLSVVIDILKNSNIKIKNITLTQSKIEIITDKLEDEVIKKIHSVLIEKSS